MSDSIENELPGWIEAWEFKKSCGKHDLGTGIILMDERGQEICTLSRGTIQDKKIALLFQASIDLLKRAKKACEIVRREHSWQIRVGGEITNNCYPPNWVLLLEEAIRSAEGGSLNEESPTPAPTEDLLELAVEEMERLKALGWKKEDFANALKTLLESEESKHEAQPPTTKP